MSDLVENQNVGFLMTRLIIWGMSNNADPDQTAPEGADSDTSVGKVRYLGIITILLENTENWLQFLLSALWIGFHQMYISLEVMTFGNFY